MSYSSLVVITSDYYGKEKEELYDYYNQILRLNLKV